MFVVKAYYVLIIAGIMLGATPAVTHANGVDVLSKIAWIALPIIVTLLGNRYFKKRDEERAENKAIFEKIDDRIGHLDKGLMEFREALLAQNAKYQGMMEKMEATANEIAEMAKDVRAHEKTIIRMETLLKQ